MARFQVITRKDATNEDVRYTSANFQEPRFRDSVERSVVVEYEPPARSDYPSESLLLKYIGSDDVDLRAKVAAHYYTPPYILRILSHDSEMAVRKACSGNANTPLDVLERLASDPDPFLANRAISLIVVYHVDLNDADRYDSFKSIFERNCLLQKEILAKNKSSAKPERMDIMAAVAELANYTDIPTERLIGILRKNSEKPGIFPETTPKRQPKRRRQRSPEWAVDRLKEKFEAAANEFSQLPPDSSEKLTYGYTLLNTVAALKRRGVPVETLPHRDAVTEAERLKAAARRARAKAIAIP